MKSSRNGASTKHRSAPSYLPDFERILPNSSEAEKGILCSALLESSVIGKCVDQGISSDDFWFAAHKIIFDLLLECWRDNEPIDLVILTQILRDRDQLDHIGGAAYITDLSCFVHTTFHVGQYIEIIREKSILRMIINECSDAAVRAYEPQEDLAGFYEEVQQGMLRIVKKFEGRSTHTRDMRELVHRSMERLQMSMDGAGEIDMPSGIPDLDYVTGGFVAPQVTVIAGKPSDGKTMIALNIAEHLAIERGKRVGIISLEMSDDQLTDRLLAAMAGVNIRALKRDRNVTPEISKQIHGAAVKLAAANIFIRDDGQLSVAEISATFSGWKAKHGLDIGIIDHAQLARGDGKTQGRTEEVENVSRALKPMAKRLEIPLIALSQVSGDEKTGYRTKNSQALTEDCDNLWTLSHGENGSWIHISKQRDGERNKSIPVTFTEHLMRFGSRITEKKPTKKETPKLL